MSESKKKAKARRKALVIGVNRVAQVDLFPPLRFAESDAEAVEECLRTDCRFTEVSLILEREATEAAIRTKMAALAMHLRPEDSLLVFFSGHGVSMPGGDSYLLASDALVDTQASRITGALNVDEFESTLRALGCRARVLLICDACRDIVRTQARGGGQAADMVLGLFSRGLHRVAASPDTRDSGDGGMRVIMSCSAGEQAFESAERGMGFFTSALLDLVKRHRRRGEQVSFSRHDSELTEQTRLAAQRVDRSQRPFSQGNVEFELLPPRKRTWWVWVLLAFLMGVAVLNYQFWAGPIPDDSHEPGKPQLVDLRLDSSYILTGRVPGADPERLRPLVWIKVADHWYIKPYAVKSTWVRFDAEGHFSCPTDTNENGSSDREATEYAVCLVEMDYEPPELTYIADLKGLVGSRPLFVIKKGELWK